MVNNHQDSKDMQEIQQVLYLNSDQTNMDNLFFVQIFVYQLRKRQQTWRCL